jgi:hypothetical protein
MVQAFSALLWQQVVSFWQQRAEQQADLCPQCQQRCERTTHEVTVTVHEQTLRVPMIYFYCRTCRRGDTPLARWLGFERGLCSSLFERELVALSTQMSFHQAAAQMLEQHGQEVNVGKVMRVTYDVAKQALGFLAHRYRQARRDLEQALPDEGIDRVVLTADGGGAPVGRLERPAPEHATKFTPLRHLPQGQRPSTHREMRVIIAHDADGPPRGPRTVDVHLAPLEQPHVSGERMVAVAVLAGFGPRTHLHGVFDMGTWIASQFERVFAGYDLDYVVDEMHVFHYVGEASQGLFPRAKQEAKRVAWYHDQTTALHEGRWASVIDALGKGEQPGVLEARRYLQNHHEHMDYPSVRAAELPSGSGEAEGGIRHLVRKRLDNAGVWCEEHLGPMGALLSLQQSGWWDEFWSWRDLHDRKLFEGRQLGLWERSFRGTGRTQKATEEAPAYAV